MKPIAYLLNGVKLLCLKCAKKDHKGVLGMIEGAYNDVKCSECDTVIKKNRDYDKPKKSKQQPT